ncbi:MAG: ABC transporter substrate-binding protein [Hyphomicrobiales bacterium]|nr:ABC transporter substrate-binding protein [Hyphomicrobiales bacterium]MDE2017295.1 ABC transporter substrate-binding protein [Hyphomicrobiales bacterium]
MTSLSLATAMGLALAGMARAEQVAIMCGSVGADQDQCKKGVQAWEKLTGNTVKIVSIPASTTDVLAFYQQGLAAGSGDVDIYQLDVIWPGIIGKYFIDLKPFSKGAEKDHFPAIVANNTVGGKLTAMPWFTDAGLLFYRKDLLDKYKLKAPTTWAEMAADAKTIQDGERKAGDAKFQGFVFQGKAYEGLTCDALEWLDSFGGGHIVNKAGKITVENAKAEAAITEAASWIGKIAPEGVLNYGEEDARGVFQSGEAAFMRNWPYAWSLGNGKDSKIAGKIGVEALPMGPGGKHTGTLGGWQLGVSKFSKHQAAAASLVMYLTSQAEEKRRAIEGSYNPTIPALYKDADVLKANPFMGTLISTFTNAVARPSLTTGAKYAEVSNDFWNAVHDVLSGKSNAKTAMASLHAQLKKVRGPGWDK